MTKILIADHDPAHLRLIAQIASAAGYATLTAGNGREALERLRTDPGIGAVALDLLLPELDGLGVLSAMAREGIAVPVIAALRDGHGEAAANALALGAVDFFTKPATPERLLAALANAARIARLETLLRQANARRAGTLGIEDILTRSPEMDRALAGARKAARGLLPVLIEGEAGTGRELMARAIHGAGERSGKSFVGLDCRALPPTLVEDILFGAPGKPGKLAEAQGGTLFLDGVGDLPPLGQARLLRVLERGEIAHADGSVERVNIRLIAATRRRLLNLALSGDVREDLYYRLNVLPITLPPLRERRADIALLAGHFIARHAAETGRPARGLTRRALDLLESFDWPGNVRQLDNAVHRAVILGDGALLDSADFPQIVALRDGRDEAARLAALQPAPAVPIHIDHAPARPPEAAPAGAIAPDRFLAADGEVVPLDDVERALIVFALNRYAGRMSQVARALRIGRSTLYRKLKEYGLDEGLDRDAA